MQPGFLDALLPAFTPGQLWAVGLVLWLGLLRPAGKLGWAVAGALIAGGVATMLVVGPWDSGLWMLTPWLFLAALLAATAAGSPLRWEPRSGPSAATALLVGAGVVHLAMAWAARTATPLARAAGRWRDAAAADADLVVTAPGLGDPLHVTAGGPLAAPAVWLTARVPGLDAGTATSLLALLAAGLVVWAAALLARHWGYTGTARATAAAVAWSPPLLLAHAVAPGALLALAALLWAWWALGEIYAGRHLPDRMALATGGLLGLAGGLALWPLVVTPLFVRRLGRRRALWFAVGIVAVAVLALAVTAPGAPGLTGIWEVAVSAPLRAAGVPGWLALAVVLVIATGTALREAPLTPTRLAAVTGAALIVTLPWWPATPAWHLTGPLAAVPFVLLAAVAPDRPGERWPPDAPLETEDLAGVGS